jgi:hypothetical protein
VEKEAEMGLFDRKQKTRRKYAKRPLKQRFEARAEEMFRGMPTKDLSLGPAPKHLPGTTHAMQGRVSFSDAIEKIIRARLTVLSLFAFRRSLAPRTCLII